VRDLTAVMDLTAMMDLTVLMDLTADGFDRGHSSLRQIQGSRLELFSVFQGFFVLNFLTDGFD
jgi:hypothetical protein